MLIIPAEKQQWEDMSQILHSSAGVPPSADLAMMGWADGGKLKIIVGFNGFLGKLCQMHVAMDPEWHFSPRPMLKQCFRYAFVVRGCEMVVGIVNSKNEHAMKFDEHLGFSELFRIPGMHDDGGDVVVFGMKKEDCRYLKMIEPVNGSGEVIVGHA